MLKTKIKDTLCIVDDDIQVVKALKRELSELSEGSGFSINCYTSPQQCLDDLKTNSEEISVILSDLRMPEMKGGDFLTKVHQEFPEIELMLLTAYKDMPEIQKAVSASISSLMMKPWESSDLQKQIIKARNQYFQKKKERLHDQKLSRQLEQAGHFQRNLLQVDLPEISNAKLDVTYLPYPNIKIGGDYYDIISIDDDKFFVVIGDVSGHGIKPSMVTAMMKVLSKNLLREWKDVDFSPSEFLNHLNPKVCHALQQNPEILITFSCLMVDVKNRKIRLSNAGHLPLYQVKSGGCLLHKVEGPALGFIPSIEYQEKEIELQEGDLIALFTDGMLEANHQTLKDSVIQRLFLQSRGKEDFNQMVIHQLKFLRGIDDFQDDVTLISIKF